jgi:hypothetical protein
MAKFIVVDPVDFGPYPVNRAVQVKNTFGSCNFERDLKAMLLL